MTSTLMPDSVILSLPESWDDIPLEEAAHRAFVKDQMSLMEQSGGLGRAELRQLELLAAWSLQAAKAGRVMLASSFLAIETADNSDGDDTLLTALLIVSALRRDEIGTDLPLSASAMVSAFADNTPSDDSTARYAHIEPPSVCKIGDYQAAKLTRLLTWRRDLKSEFRQFLQTYLVSCADGDAVIVLQFSTTNFQHAKPFSDLFHRIARTLRILYPDDPTFVDD
ncbi:hypothetical protein [Candidatus Poriferisodalis sp.]|uniref:hypothetical protein n=1 Tax=Candidatus Poriferisodalis sp. TaxID=3101277 RepID=UPI003AF8AA32